MALLLVLLKETVSRGEPIKPDRSEKIDRILMNRYLGYPILLVFLWALFQATYTLGEYPQHLIERGIAWLSGVIHTVMSRGHFGICLPMESWAAWEA